MGLFLAMYAFDMILHVVNSAENPSTASERAGYCRRVALLVPLLLGAMSAFLYHQNDCVLGGNESQDVIVVQTVLTRHGSAKQACNANDGGGNARCGKYSRGPC